MAHAVHFSICLSWFNHTIDAARPSEGRGANEKEIERVGKRARVKEREDKRKRETERDGCGRCYRGESEGIPQSFAGLAHALHVS